MRILSVTSMKDEGPFLLEWIAYHRLIGVTEFLVFTNDCSDGTDSMLDALAAEGIVTHVRQEDISEKGPQWQALATAWKHPLRKDADWIMFTDVDEYPFIKSGAHRLFDLITELPDRTDAVAMPWRLFGAGGVVSFRDQPVTEQFQFCAPPDLIHPVAASLFKTLFRPAAFRAAGIHRPKHHKGAAAPRWVDGAGVALPDSFGAQDGRLSLLGISEGRSLVELHHYSLRSVESFIVKSARGLANRKGKSIDLAYWVERNFNSERNQAMRLWSKPLAAEIASLKALPGVAALHEAACDWHRATFARAVTRAEPYRLYCHCLHARSSEVLPKPLALRLLRMFGELKEE